MEADRQKAQRDALFKCAEDYDVNEIIQAMASAMTTLVIYSTQDRDAAMAALDRLFANMRAHVEDVARPAGAPRQKRAGANQRPVQIVNRYVTSDNVAGAAVVFDAAAIDAHSPRTRANGQAIVATEALADGDHVMHIVPDPTSAAPVGPAVAEGLGDAVKRMFRSLDVNVAVRKGKITTLSVKHAQALNGTVLGGTNPVRVQLQPIYHRSPFQNPHDRTGTDLTLGRTRAVPGRRATIRSGLARRGLHRH
jgi:hypothetical protein